MTLVVASLPSTGSITRKRCFRSGEAAAVNADVGVVEGPMDRTASHLAEVCRNRCWVDVPLALRDHALNGNPAETLIRLIGHVPAQYRRECSQQPHGCGEPADPPRLDVYNPVVGELCSRNTHVELVPLLKEL